MPEASRDSLVRRLIDRVLGSVDWLAPSLRAYRLAACEYVHAGELFYDDGASALYRIAPGQYWRRFGPILRQELEAVLKERDAAKPRA